MMWGIGARPEHWSNVNFYRRPVVLGPEFERLVNDGYD